MRAPDGGGEEKAIAAVQDGIAAPAALRLTTGGRTVEMAERWKAWKTKIRFSTLPTAPWKSRKGGEIPTFPQLRRFVPRAKKTGDRKKCGPWKSGNPKAGFPLSHSPDSRRRKEEDCSNQSLKGTGRAAPTGIISCSSCIGNGSSFHAHPSIGKCSLPGSPAWEMGSLDAEVNGCRPPE